MTLGRRAPDGVQMLITRLDDLEGTADWRKPSGSPWPWFMVNDLPGGTTDKITDHRIYSVHTFHPDYWECKRYAEVADDHILSMAPPLGAQERIVLADGRVVFADEVHSSTIPHKVEHSDDLVQYLARYAVKLRRT